jgi:hypothetical protein
MTDQGRGPQDSGDHLSEAEFERAEDRIDDLSRPRGVTRSGWQRHQRHSLLGAALVFAALVSAIVVIGGGGRSSSLPSCKARSHQCRETADGYWVPVWYYGALSLAQGTSIAGTGRAPSTAGTQPSATELRQAGATPDEADEAESYGQSANSADSSDGSGSDDSGSDDSSDGGGGDGGGGDGGGD